MNQTLPDDLTDFLDSLVAEFLANAKNQFLPTGDVPPEAARKKALLKAQQLHQTAFINWQEQNPERLVPCQVVINQIARRLLVPTQDLAKTARQNGFDLFALRKDYPAAPLDILASRLLNLPDPCVITIMDNGHLTSRESNFPLRGKEMFPLEVKVWEQCHKSSRVKKESRLGWVVYAWPVHEVDWKREILRTVVPEIEV
ncbi:MAG: hypothetical protein EXR99_00640 [Gemmataceae bacterium]|nr:hypothetical protein [Gemmataceae bacterium]